MKRSFLAINYLLVALLTMSSAAAAQTTARANSDWEIVKSLPHEELLTVTLKGGSTVDGSLISVSETALRIYKSDQSPTSGIVYDDIVELKKENILKVYRVERKSGKHWVLIGAAVGAAAGAGLGVALGRIGSNCQPINGPLGDPFNDTCRKARNAFIPVTAVGGASMGALIGHMVGRGRLKRVLVYQSK